MSLIVKVLWISLNPNEKFYENRHPLPTAAAASSAFVCFSLATVLVTGDALLSKNMID